MGEVPGGLPNPYCIAQVGEAFEQTNIVARSREPAWGSRALTMIFQDLIENDIHFALVTVLHKDMSGGEDTPLGLVKIPLSGVFNSPHIPTTEWYPLIAIPTSDVRVPADSALQVEMTYFVGNEDGVIPDPDDFIDDEKEVKPPNMLYVNIVRARNLKPPKGASSCNSYVSLSVSGQKGQTKTVPSSNSPKVRARASALRPSPRELSFAGVCCA